MRSRLGSGAAVQGSGSRCGTIGATLGAVAGGASVCGGTSRAELVLVARRGDSGSTAAGAGAVAGALPDEQATRRAKAKTRTARRRWKKLVIKTKGRPHLMHGRPFDDPVPIK